MGLIDGIGHVLVSFLTPFSYAWGRIRCRLHVVEASFASALSRVIMRKCHQYQRSGQEVPHQAVELSQPRFTLKFLLLATAVIKITH